jgi:hypothetical protein
MRCSSWSRVSKSFSIFFFARAACGRLVQDLLAVDEADLGIRHHNGGKGQQGDTGKD